MHRHEPSAAEDLPAGWLRQDTTPGSLHEGRSPGCVSRVFAGGVLARLRSATMGRIRRARRGIAGSRGQMTRVTLADAAAQVLAQRRALSSDELGRMLAERGLTRAGRPARAVSRALGNDPRFRRLTDDRWVVPGQLLDRSTLTHRLRPEEARHGVLALDGDLASLEVLAGVGIRLPDGRPLTFLFEARAREAVAVDCDAALTGPEGWLDQPAGTLLHVRLEADRLDVRSGPEPTAESRMAVRRLAEAARARLAVPPLPFLPPAVLLEALVLDLLADDPSLLERPVAPLEEALGAAGLEVHRGWIGLPGTDWAAFDESMSFDEDEEWDEEWDDDADRIGGSSDQSADDLDQALAGALGLTEMEVDGLGIVLGAFDLYQRLGGFDETGTLAHLAQIVAFPGIAQLLALRAWSESALEPFMAALDRSAREADAAGVRVVLAACAEARDDVTEAERLLRAALAADPTFGPALVELARYEQDRGDYRAALAHLRSAGAPQDDPQRVSLEAVLRPAVPKVGRNESCPCGSGRKYKACHLGRPEEVAVDTAGALLRKVSSWLGQPDNQRHVAEVVRFALAEKTGAGPDDLIDQPLVNDIVLFDRRQLERFLDVRGSLLPEPERALGRSWLVSRRSLHEVQAVRPGIGVTLKDLLGGEVVDLGDRTISRGVEPLDLVCLRLLPDGAGGVTTGGGFLVPRLQRRRVIDLLTSDDGMALLRWFAAPGLPIEMRNTEGEPLHFVTATYRVVDPLATAAALARKLRDEGDGRFVETVTRHGQPWLRGSIRLEGDRATIEANSARRADRLERTLLGAAPGARLVEREERSVEDALEEPAAGRKGKPAAEPIDLDANPEAAAALEEFIRDYEDRWVDEPIPALGGLTPRQAATNEAARPELEALLDDMAWEGRRSGERGRMDAGRVRRLLGLGQVTR